MQTDALSKFSHADEFFVKGGFFFLTLEFYQGGSLSYHLDQQRLALGKRRHQLDCGLDQTLVKFYAAQILVAVEAMHQKGIVHRDLKPANILLDMMGHIKVVTPGTLPTTLSPPPTYFPSILAPPPAFSMPPSPTVLNPTSPSTPDHGLRCEHAARRQAEYQRKPDA